VPRTQGQIDQLLDERPPYWEFLLFAGALFQYKAVLEPKWIDHDTGIGRVSAVQLDVLEAMRFLSNAMDLLKETISQELRVFDPEAKRRAFGGRLEPGDPLRILSMARHLATGYEAMLDWSSELRGLRVPEGMREMFELTARMADQPIAQVRTFIDELVRDMDELPRRVSTGENVRVSSHLVLSVDELLLPALDASGEEFLRTHNAQ
jgi:hypothetical protein